MTEIDYNLSSKWAQPDPKTYAKELEEKLGIWWLTKSDLRFLVEQEAAVKDVFWEYDVWSQIELRGRTGLDDLPTKVEIWLPTKEPVGTKAPTLTLPEYRFDSMLGRFLKHHCVGLGFYRGYEVIDRVSRLFPGILTDPDLKRIG